MTDQRTYQAFDEFVREFGPLLHRAVLRACPSGMGLSSDDIEQEALLKIWQAMSSGREITNYPSYIWRVTMTTTIDAIRRVKARREEQLETDGEGREDAPPAHALLPADPVASPDRIAQGREVEQKIRRSLTRLSDERRLVVGLYLQGFSVLDVADMLKWSEPKTRNLTYRGLKDMRAFLREEGIDYEIG
ncbi:MAG: RNA polymerase sigma factor [Acidobacteriota bacterium]